jgi:hypothetical protein
MRISVSTTSPVRSATVPQALASLAPGLYQQHNNQGIFLLVNGKRQATVIDVSGANQRGNAVKNPIRSMREPQAACWVPATTGVSVTINPS